MSDWNIPKEYLDQSKEIAYLKADLKETVSLKYHDDLMHEWKVSEVAKDKRIAELQARVTELEAALRGYVKATTGQESAIVTFPMALEGEVK